MIVGRASRSSGSIYIMAQVGGQLQRVGRYHTNSTSAKLAAIKLKAELGSRFVQVLNRNNGWSWIAP